MPDITLYQRDDCHLCDLALEVLAQARAPEFASVFIDGDETLEARFGVRVPVLRDQARGIELDWPFDAAMLLRFLGDASPATEPHSRGGGDPVTRAVESNDTGFPRSRE